MNGKLSAGLMAIVLLLLASLITIQATSTWVDTDEVQKAWDYVVDADMGEGFSANARSANNVRQALYGSFPRSRTGDRLYPDFYGGSYTDANGNFVLLIASGTADAHVEMSLNALRSSGDFIVRYVEFSYFRENFLDCETISFSFGLAAPTWGFGITPPAD
jgi:hypothetical protein